MKLFFFMVFTICNTIVFSQNANAVLEQQKTESASINEKKVLIIPFEPRLYRSELDKEIVQKTGKNIEVIRNQFRNGLTNELFISVKQSGFTPLVLSEENANQKNDLRYIYQSIAHEYVEMPMEEKQQVENPGIRGLVEKTKDKLETKKESEKQENGVQNGQITSSNSNAPKYMNVQITNPNLLQTLAKTYETKYFIFVNQLDLLNAYENTTANYETENYKKAVKIHYTILDIDGKEIKSGAYRNTFPNNFNNPELIIESSFRGLTNSISKHIPGPQIQENTTTKSVTGNTEEEKKKEENSTLNLKVPTIKLPQLNDKKEEKQPTEKSREENKEDVFDDY